MALIDEIRKKIEAEQFEFSKHAVDQSIIRRISVQEVRELFGDAEVIEDYPNDLRGSCCLVAGTIKGGEYIRLVVSYPPRPKVITGYRLNPDEWIDFRTRRQT